MNSNITTMQSPEASAQEFASSLGIALADRFTRKGRYSVYVGRLSRGCEPKKANEIPAGIDFASVLLRNTFVGFGQRFCRAYNARQLANGIPGRRWAVVVMRVKSIIRPCEAEDNAALELLDAFPLSLNADCRDAVGRGT